MAEFKRDYGCRVGPRCWITGMESIIQFFDAPVREGDVTHWKLKYKGGRQ
jgi:hypothetical protein